MNLRQYLGTMIFSTILCWAAWIFVLIQVDPFASGSIGFIFFYVSLALALIGTVSLIIFGMYRLFGSKEMPLFRHVRMSFRSACVMSILLILGAYLQAENLLTFLNATIFVIICILIISFDLSLTSLRKT